MTEASTGPGSPSRTALPAGSVWLAGLLATLAATVVNLVAWLLVQQVFDADLQVPREPGSTVLQDLPLAQVIMITVASGVVGAVALWLLTRRGPSGVRRWTLLAATFGLLSGLAAFQVDVSFGKQLGLFGFHLLTTVVVVAVARQQLGPRAQ